MFLAITVGCFVNTTAFAQNVGIGSSTPGEKLDVDGAIKVGNTSGNNAGSIRYISGTNKFQINIGGTWYDIATGNLAYINAFSYNATTNELSITEGSTVHMVDLDDLQDNTDDQVLTLSANNLSIEDGNSVSLAAYLDNTDNQTLSYNATSNVLTLLNGGTVDLSDLQDNTDDQQLTYNATSNVLTLEDGGTVNLSDLQDNTDDQQLTYNATTNVLTLESGGTVNLTDLQDNTDDQNLTLSGNSLSIESGNSVSLSGFLDNTDDQNLTLSGNTLSIESGNSVSLAAYLDNTDNQALGYNSGTNVLTLSNGGSVDLSDLQDNTDDQTLTISSNVLYIESGNNVDLNPYLDNTDDQQLTYNATTNVLTLESGGTVNLSDLQDNTDDQTLQEVYDQNGNTVLMNPTIGDIRYYKSGTEILTLSQGTGAVGIGTSSPTAKLQVEETYTGTLAEMGRFVHNRSDITDADEGGYISMKVVDSNNGGASFDHARISWRNNGTGADENEGELAFWTATNGATSQKAVINNAGNLGIGTATPAAKLHVQGSTRMSSLAGSGTRLVQTDNNGTLSISSMNPSVTPQGSGTANYLARWTSGTGLGIGTTYDNGSNVGIGTTDPKQKLHVVGNLQLAEGGAVIEDDDVLMGDNDDWIQLNGHIQLAPDNDLSGVRIKENDSGQYFGLTQKNGYSYLSDNDVSANYFLRGNGANAYTRGDLIVHGSDVYDDSGNLRLNGEDNLYLSMDHNNNDTDTRAIMFGKNDEGGDANWIELMRLQENGRLGVGVSAPTNYVDISTGVARSGTHSSNMALYVTANSGANSAGVEFRHANGTQGIGFGYNTIYASGSNANQDLSMASKGTGVLTFQTSSTERLRIQSNGNIGVGTTGASQKLDVNGSIRIRGGSPAAGKVLVSGADGTGTWTTLNGSGYGDNLGNHAATANINMGNREIDNINYLDIRAATGYGIRFWSDNQYKISMGNSADYKYGTVTDYSIKMNMSNTSTRGWTWGVNGVVPTTALDINGNLTMAGDLNVVGADIKIANKHAFRGNDAWLRLNQDNAFTSGTYTPYLIRADGGFQVDAGTVIDAAGRYHYSVGTSVNKWGAVNSSGFGVDAKNSGDWDLLIYEDLLYGPRLTLGYGYTNGYLTTYDSNEHLYIDPNGSGNVYIHTGSAGNIGVGTTTASQRLTVSGRIKTTGINETSDIRLKKNIKPIDSNEALSNILEMRGVTYDWRSDEYPEKGLVGGMQYGLIAQELEKIVPELVDTDEEGWKSIDYSHIVPIMIEALQAQNELIDKQNVTLNKLQGEMDQLKAEKADGAEKFDDLLQRLVEIEKELQLKNSTVKK